MTRHLLTGRTPSEPEWIDRRSTALRITASELADSEPLHNQGMVWAARVTYLPFLCGME